MFKNPKRALFLLAASTIMLEGCFGGSWWKYIVGATAWGSDFTNILEHFNVLNGY